jgi:ribosomal protein L37AE/L43A
VGLIRLKALRSLRWNYTRKGVWVWLKGRKRCSACRGTGMLRYRDLPKVIASAIWTCDRCDGSGKGKRGYQRILTEPEQVIAEQERAAYERVARTFHGIYEATAPDHGYETRPESRVAWEDVPEKNRALMIGTVRRLAETGVIVIGGQSGGGRAAR